MTRKTDRLEALARDLASRYGEDDVLVQSVRSAIPKAKVIAPASKTPFTSERRLKAQGPMGRKKSQDLNVA